MEYRKFPHGGGHERFGVLGLGMGGIQKSPDEMGRADEHLKSPGGGNFFAEMIFD
jgi:hypothetical protein